ncbi:unnamed protein product [Caenorhabditis sp. 36 PRJEB53466]|nr:unnamed protein product [Caenorhabditis sp. 36 PRJEB53466]
MGSAKGELVVLTSIKQSSDHNIVRIDREETAKAEKVLLIAGGHNCGLIVNKYEENASYDDVTEAEADVSLSFSVSLTDKEKKKVQEKRSLFFKLRKGVDLDVGRAVVHKFFRSLLSNLPGDYVSFLKRVMTMMLKDFNEIASLTFDLKIVDETEQVIIPDATQYDSGSELEDLTCGHVQDVLEHAFPNGLDLPTLTNNLRCTEEEVLGFLKELEASGVARKVDDEWIRVDTKRVDESVEAHRHASTSGASGSYGSATGDQQPTVAIITCLFVEKQAIDSLIEESSTIHKYKSGGDSNVYTLGRIGEHRVVATKLALIGDSREAITSAGSITTRLLGNFQNIEHVFIVGVGGAVPHFTDASLHARLGDVIVSASHPHQYVYAHDLFINKLNDQVTGFQCHNWAAKDPAIEQIVQEGGEDLREKWNAATEEAVQRLSELAADVEWKAPPESTDVLAMPVSKGNVVVMPHPNPERQGPEIHLGTVGAMSSMKKYEGITGGGDDESSINQIRESFAESFKIRCMDAGFDSVVGAVVGSCVKSWALVRGISDYHYGQSRAGKVWQAHAAARAAGMTRCIIEKLPNSA